MSNSETEQQTLSSEDGKNANFGWKTTLCQFYIQGNCNKSTDACNFAHGTSDLRTPEGNPIGFEPSLDKYKSTLCAKFLSIGSCPFGVACRFAHGVRELQKPQNKNNPLFKTTLCKPYSELGFCPNAVNCQFAHGAAELRSKPSDTSFELNNLTPEEHRRRLEKARNMPGYKTKICSRFRDNNHCEYGELCHFIHGNEAPLEDDNMDPTYKTSMCRKVISKENCEYGSKCRFAHSKSELRCPGAHSQQPPLQPAAFLSPSFKTVLCSNYNESGHCKYGDNCQFAHGSQQLRGQSSFHQPPPKYPGGPCNGGMCPANNIRSQIPCPHNGGLSSPRDRLLITMIRSSNLGLNTVRGNSMKSKRRRYQPRLNNKV